jgi:penicillin-binding protein 2
MFTALQKSCNVFFYELGRLLTIDRMNYYCRYFGLGSKTGIEIGEAAGVLAGPQNRNQNGGSWAAGETIAAAIGQSDNRFTPIQLASYAATLANNGVRYKAHLVHSILAGDGSVVSVTKPEILSDLDIPQQASDAVRQAMISVTQTGGTAAKAFAGAQYTVAAKTGTSISTPFCSALCTVFTTAVLSPEKLKSYFPAVCGVGRGYLAVSAMVAILSRLTPPG